jgi:hypothetical protein
VRLVLGQLKNSVILSGIEPVIPACSIVSEPTRLTRAPVECMSLEIG